MKFKRLADIDVRGKRVGIVLSDPDRQRLQAREGTFLGMTIDGGYDPVVSTATTPGMAPTNSGLTLK